MIDSELSRRRLSHFVRAAWHIVEPGSPFVDNWHIGLICEYLEAVLSLEINNLIINLPPRHMKSLLVSVFFPAWSWLRQPGLRWLTGSYASQLAVRDALKTRRLLQSDWYQQRYGKLVTLRADQNRKSRYENTAGGSRVTFSFNSAFTGEGGDVLLVDDPLRAQDADNPTQRRRVNEIYDTALTTRANDPRNPRRVIVMQRLHEQDLTGHLLAEGNPMGYQHLCLPAEYMPKLFLSWGKHNDPRELAGEALWPARFGDKEIRQARLALGEQAYAGQYQQQPYSAGGTIYRADWWQAKNRFEIADESHLVVARWLSWDTALKDGEHNDASAMVVMELQADYRLRLRACEWGKYTFPQLAAVITQQAERWNYDDKLRGVVIEDKASGISALQTLEQSATPSLAGKLAAFSPGHRSKAARARQASLWCERGCVLLPNPSEQTPWLFDFEQQLVRFPSAAINDPVDAFTQAILFLENFLAEGWRATLGHVAVL